jgi:hypothetical protein
MSTMSHRRTLAALTTGALLAFPTAALADPPGDSVSMYRHGHAPAVRDYSKNSVSGEFTPSRQEFTPPRQDSQGVTPIHDQIGPVVASPSTSSDGFAWADAAAGAGIALLITAGAGVGGRRVARRHRPVAGITH